MPRQVPLIAEGDYDAIVLSCRKERRFTRDLLAFQFRIVSQGSAFGTVLPGYCNLDFGRGRGRQLPARCKLAVWLRKINAFAPEVSYKRVHITPSGNSNLLSAWQPAKALPRIHCRPPNTIRRLPISRGDRSDYQAEEPELRHSSPLFSTLLCSSHPQLTKRIENSGMLNTARVVLRKKKSPREEGSNFLVLGGIRSSTQSLLTPGRGVMAHCPAALPQSVTYFKLDNRTPKTKEIPCQEMNSQPSTVC